MTTREIGLVKSCKSPVTESVEMSMDQLCAKLSVCSIGDKDGSGWIPSSIQPGDRTDVRVQSVSILVFDVEAKAEPVLDPKTGEKLLDTNGDVLKQVVGPMPPSVDAMVAELHARDWSAFLHTSYSHLNHETLPHDVDHHRYRLVFELSRTLSPSELKPLGNHVALLLGLSECIDKACLSPSHLYYFPRCPDEERRSAFQFERFYGDKLPVDALLSAADAISESRQVPWKDRSSGAQSNSIIDTFNSVQSLGDILLRNGYREVDDERWLSPCSTSSLPGVCLIPRSNPPMIFSHHNSDALSDGKPHDAFDVFRILEHDGDLNSALQAAAVLLNITYQPAKDTAPSIIEIDEKRPPPWFKEFAADRMANATYRQLTLAERGLLDTLRREYWVSGVDGINPDPKRLARLTGYPEKEISKALPAILAMFQTDGDGLLYDEDLLRQYDELCRKRQKKRVSGRKGGKVSASRRAPEKPPF